MMIATKETIGGGGGETRQYMDKCSTLKPKTRYVHLNITLFYHFPPVIQFSTVNYSDPIGFSSYIRICFQLVRARANYVHCVIYNITVCKVRSK